MSTTRTNWRYRELVDFTEVPKGVLESDFSYRQEADAEYGEKTYFRYRGQWHNLDGFVRFGYPGPTQEDHQGWQAGAADHAWGGVVIRLSDDGERVRVGYQSF